MQAAVIRKRRRKKKLELERQHRLQVRIILGGAVLAAVAATAISSSCRGPLPLDETTRDQLEELARDAEVRSRSSR